MLLSRKVVLKAENTTFENNQQKVQRIDLKKKITFAYLILLANVPKRTTRS